MEDRIEKLMQLKELLDENIITEEEFNQKKKALLSGEADTKAAVETTNTKAEEKNEANNKAKTGGKYTVRKVCSIAYIVVGVLVALLGIYAGGVLNAVGDDGFIGTFIVIYGLLVACIGIIQLISSKNITRGKEVFFGIFNLIVAALCLFTGFTFGNILFGAVAVSAAIAYLKK